MAFFRKLFHGGGKNKKKDYPNIIQGVDPLESWVKVGELGDGAFGKVFKTEHRVSKKLAAMKRVPIQDDTELDDFMVEIDILAECKHPNIVGLHEAYFYDQALWIYIEFCAGGAVDDIIVELDHGLSEPQIHCISQQLFEALNCLHNARCIHRDLKAGNILLCPDGSIRLADFGVSAMDSAKGKQKHDTFIGTPYWMAPEVVVCETIKDDPYDYTADIWSAGITMIELADMNPPYSDMSPMRVLQKIVKKEPPTLELPSKWSKEFNDIIAKCLVKVPSGRPSAATLLEHPFIAGVTDNRPLRILYQEVKSEVQEIVEELPEDADLLTDPGHSQREATPPPRDVATPASNVGPEAAVVPAPTSSDTGPEAMEIHDTAEPKTVEPEPDTTGREPESAGTPTPEVVNTVESPLPEVVSPIKTPVESPLPNVSSPAPELTSPIPDLTSPIPDMTSPVPESDQESSRTGDRNEETSSLSSELSTPEERGGHKYATLSRVRKFKVDGQVIESTTKKIVDVTANKTLLRDNKRFQQMRKQDFRELKQLQREEMKEATEFYAKIKVDREVQDKKCEGENIDLEKRYENELEVVSKRQKKEVSKQEGQHVQQFKSRLKYTKVQQTKDMKRFKENLKEEEKLALKRVELSGGPKSERKVALNKTKLDLHTKREAKEAAFFRKQSDDLENEVRQILKEQKDERKALELSFLDAKHDLRRNHTSLLWEMEQRQKQDRHQLLKQQLREAFHMQRHQMHTRHQMEVDLQGRRDQFQLEELRQKQILEKRQLPKKLKADHKQKVTEARKAMRNKKADKDSLRKLDEQYVKLCQLETELMNDRHEKEMETLKAELEVNMRELQEIQNEKKMQLTQQEANKVKERDEQHTVELREWRGEIANRKQKLEEEFRASREEQEQFYSLDRPIPKALRTSLSLPGGDVDRNERAEKAMSVSSAASLDPREVPSFSKSRPPLTLDPLDEVVLGTPPLNHASPSRSLPANSKNTLQNGNST